MKYRIALLSTVLLTCLVLLASSQSYSSSKSIQPVALGSISTSSSTVSGTSSTTAGTAPVRSGGPVIIGSNAVNTSSSASGVPLRASVLNITGTISLNLADFASRNLNLNLIQNSGVVLGQGSLVSGNETLPVTASGSLNGNTLDLFVTPTAELETLRMLLSINGNSVSGSYNVYLTGSRTWSGTASGTLNQAGAQPSSGVNATATAVEAQPITSTTLPVISVVPAVKSIGGSNGATGVSATGGPKSYLIPGNRASGSNPRGISQRYQSTYNGMATTTYGDGSQTVTTPTGDIANTNGVVTTTDNTGGSVTTSY
jgi:hypothetical protein